MSEIKIKGKYGEDIAVQYLQERGYKIISRNWQFLHREIDIIAEKNDQIIFFEVKTRKSGTILQPYEAVNSKKQRLLVDAANLFLQRNPIDKEARFDIISITITEKNIKIEHIENAFYPKIKHF